MPDISALLSCSRPFVHVIEEPAEQRLPFNWPFIGSEEIIARRLRGQKMRTVESLFDEVGAALQFPDYFGENWAAFDECLADLAWMPGKAYALIVHDADQVLELDQASAFNSFVQIVDRVAAEWSSLASPSQPWKHAATPFHMILMTSASHVKALTERVEGASVIFSSIA